MPHGLEKPNGFSLVNCCFFLQEIIQSSWIMTEKSSTAMISWFVSLLGTTSVLFPGVAFMSFPGLTGESVAVDCRVVARQ